MFFMTRKLVMCGSLTLLVLLATTIAKADTIVVTTDRVIENADGAALDLDGTTFIANARGAADLSMLPAVLHDGDDISLTHKFNTTFNTPFEFGGSAGHALVEGTTYNDVILRASNFDFETSSLALRAGVSSTPFTFTGTLTGLSNSGGAQLFSDDLLGHGTASIVTHASANGTLALDGVFFAFDNSGSGGSGSASPTPEPKSLATLGLGLLGLAAVWRAREAVGR